jgi:hypothetical protein
MARRRLANFADQYLRHILALRQQEAQSELVGQRQTQLADLNNQSEMLKSVLGDPTGAIAAGLLRGGRRDVGGLPLEALVRSPRTLTSGVSDDIGKSTGFENLPTETDIRQRAGTALERAGYDPAGADAQGNIPLGRVNAPTPEGGLPSANLVPQERPDIQSLIAQRSAKRDAIINELERKADYDIALEGGKTWERAKKENEAANLYLPDALSRNSQIESAANERKLAYERSLNPIMASRAGAVEGAQTAAEIQTKNRLLPILAKIEEEVAKARLAGRPNNAVAEKTTQELGQRMVNLATALNTNQSRLSARGVGAQQKIADATGLPITQDGPLLDDMGRPVMGVDGKGLTIMGAFHELEALRQGYTSVLLRKLGRVGTPTENDESRTRAIMPSWGLTPEENKQINANFLKIIQSAERIGSSLGAIDPNLPPEQQEAEVARRLQEAAQDAGFNNVTVGPDGQVQFN